MPAANGVTNGTEAATPAQTTAVNDRKRVKVYELKDNDWYDRGTGFCVGQAVAADDARIYVQSEDDPARMLLETRVSKDDGYQKQQDTLIVWTESNGVDMALSFQEPDGCTGIWEFLCEVQQRLVNMASEEMDDDMMDNGALLLPIPELGNLHEIENIMRQASQSNPGRDALSKFVMAPESLYITKVVPLVEMAEDLEDLPSLHRLCNIMKILILLNDSGIIEFIVRDEMILGVVGALEYDPDFPSHKANHRQYLANNSKFKEVVKIDDQEIRRKIHHTYRLHYLKDVVLARILDDPTFSVLNSLIFFYQVDIVNHIQANGAFLNKLFTIFASNDQNANQKKDAVLFIQHLCGIAKNLQAAPRAQLFQNFINNGLFNVITYALTHTDSPVRVAGSDILVALIEHDPTMMRTYIFRAINEKAKPLTDTLVELLLVEQDLGVKTQMADAIKVLLDPTSNSTSMDMLGRTNGDFMQRMRPNVTAAPQTDTFIQNFYDESAKKLFQPLKGLVDRSDFSTITMQDALLYEHLIGILAFFMRVHTMRCRYFVIQEGLHSRIAQLMSCPQKHLKLAVIRWFRGCISLGDEYHIQEMINNRLLEPVLDLLEKTRNRDNLLNSACLELFQYIRCDANKALVVHLVETYRLRLSTIDYVDLFEEIIARYEASQNEFQPVAEDTSFSTEDTSTPNRGLVNGGAQRWGTGLREVDMGEEAYFNGSDGEAEEEEDSGLPSAPLAKHLTNGASPVRQLVDYPDDEEGDEVDGMEGLVSTSTLPTVDHDLPKVPPVPSQAPEQQAPESPEILQQAAPDRPPEKRRREDDGEDVLDALATGSVVPKRRSSVGSTRSTRSETRSKSPSPNTSPLPGKENEHVLRRKGSLRSKDSAAASKAAATGISITLKNGAKEEQEGSSEGS